MNLPKKPFGCRAAAVSAATTSESASLSGDAECIVVYAKNADSNVAVIRFMLYIELQK